MTCGGLGGQALQRDAQPVLTKIRSTVDGPKSPTLRSVDARVPLRRSGPRTWDEHQEKAYPCATISDFASPERGPFERARAPQPASPMMSTVYPYENTSAPSMRNVEGGSRHSASRARRTSVVVPTFPAGRKGGGCSSGACMHHDLSDAACNRVK